MTALEGNASVYQVVYPPSLVTGEGEGGVFKDVGVWGSTRESGGGRVGKG